MQTQNLVAYNYTSRQKIKNKTKQKQGMKQNTHIGYVKHLTWKPI
jgi:hypothetical protein